MAVAAGDSHTVVVGEDGSVFSFGKNYSGQLGTGDDEARLAPTRLTELPVPVRQVAAGYYHTGIVTEVGDLFMFGQGYYGRLGLGDQKERTTPTLVARAVFDGEAVLMVACGDAHTAAVTEEGGVYTFGHGEFGQLGHGDEENQLAPRRVPAAAFRPNASVEGPDERIVMVAAGGSHTVALSEAGHVFTWGDGEVGQLGHDDKEQQLAPRQVEAGRFGGERVVFVAAGGAHTVAVTAGGRLYAWGYGGHGQLGHGHTGCNRLVPTLVNAGAFGAPEGGRVLMAACGGSHTLVVTQDGGLWACGRGYDGQLGMNDEENRHVFERVGAGAFGGARVVAAAAGFVHSAAVTEDGALWTWGRGDYRQLGLVSENEIISVPRRVTSSPLDSMRVGRFNLLPKDHMLAMAMGQQGRLGANSKVKALNTDILNLIFENSHGLRLNHPQHRALVVLMGGYHLLKRRICQPCSQ